MHTVTIYHKNEPNVNEFRVKETAILPDDGRIDIHKQNGDTVRYSLENVSQITHK